MLNVHEHLKGHSGFENGFFRVLSAFGSLIASQCTPIDFCPRLFRVRYGFTAHFYGQQCTQTRGTSRFQT